MTKDIYISLFEYASCQINSRQLVTSLFIQSKERMVLDFNKIDFVTRSAMHEFTLQERNNKVVYINMNSNVKKMYKIVKISNKSNRKHIREIFDAQKLDANNNLVPSMF